MGERKIGTEELLAIRSHARSLYLKLPQEVIDSFGLAVGDVLRVEIKSVVKK